MSSDMLQSAVNGTRRVGQNQLVKYLKGGKLTFLQSIKAKCYDCNGMGESDSCDMVDCSLYPHSQFRVDKPVKKGPSTRAGGVGRPFQKKSTEKVA